MILPEVLQNPEESRGRLFPDQYSRDAIIDDIQDTPLTIGDDRRTACLRFHGDDPRIFPLGKEECRCFRVEPWQHLILYSAEELDGRPCKVAESLLVTTFSYDDEWQLQLIGNFNEEVEALVWNHPADGEEVRRCDG